MERNIYKRGKELFITSDEEIKEGDYSLYLPFGVGKNIVIDGELCFHIEAKDGKGSFTQRTYQTLDRNKKIILTTDQDLIKESGVQAIDDEFLEWFVKNPNCEEVEVESWQPYADFWNDYKIIIPKEGPNKTHYLDELPNMDKDVLLKMWESAIPKLKLKQERMYSEEDMIHFNEWVTIMYPNQRKLLTTSDKRGFYTTKELLIKWFEQFKKK